MIKRFMERILPPGYPTDPEWGFWIQIFLNTVYGMYFSVGFSSNFRWALGGLYKDRYTMKILNGTTMPAFSDIARGLGWYVPVAILVCLLGVLLYYRFFTKTTNSIYLMKRIAKREIFVRCLGYPLLSVGMIIVFFALTIAFCLLIYFTKTPPECLPEKQFFSLWEVILWSN